MKKVWNFKPYKQNRTKHTKFKLLLKPGFKPFGPLGYVQTKFVPKGTWIGSMGTASKPTLWWINH